MKYVKEEKPGGLPQYADMKAWERQPGETVRSFDAFSRYLHMPERSLRALVGEKYASERQIKTWSSRHEWQARIRAYDDEQLRVAESAARSVARERGQVWADRKIAARETGFQLANLLVERASRLLKLPINKTEFEGEAVELADGSFMRPVTKIIYKETPRDAARFADVAIKLLNLSTGQATENIAFTDLDVNTVDIENMTPEELADYEIKLNAALEASYKGVATPKAGATTENK